MSTYASTPVACGACRAEQAVVLPESANVARRPAYRQEVLERSFMRFVCERCGALTTVERELLYTDLDHGLFVLVFPRQEAAHHRRLAALAREVFRRAVLSEAPPVVARMLGHLEPRLVFGWEALREKVLANDHGLDDRVLEALKHVLLTGLPRAALEGVEDLVLVEVEPDRLAFAEVGARIASEERPLLLTKREVYDDLAARRALLVQSGWLSGPWVHRSLLAEAGA
ncbi:MAG: CpXC domain-containing protein [Myxococcota bacterium]